MREKESRKYAIYSRKSKFTGKGESIENQIELCRQYIKLNDPSVAEDNILIFEDEGFSGGNTNRPQFQAMMKQVRQNQIRAVVCYKLDRISRNVGDFAKLKDEFDDYNVGFISIRDNFDTSSPSGRAMMMMVSVFAQLERENTAERIRDNMRELAKTGRWLGGTTPTGYKSVQIVGSVTVDGKERKAYKLDIVKEEAEIVRLIYAKFLETNSLTQIDTYLLQNHITSKNGKDYTRFSIRAILQNPVYMIADQDAWDYFESLGVELYASKSDFDGKHGVMAYNKTLQKSGKSTKLRSVEEWIIAVGKHSGMISGADWIKVQKMLEQNSSKSYHKPKSNVALLSGLLYCGDCGSFMRPKLSKRENAQGEKIYCYLCETKERSHGERCSIKNPNGNELDKMVCEQIKQISEDSSTFMKGLENVQNEIESTRVEFDQQLSAFQKELQENEAQITTLVSSISKVENTPAFDYISAQINALHEANVKIKNRIAELESLIKPHSYSSDELEKMRDIIKSFAKTFDTMNVEQKRMALRAFIRKIIWDGENIHVILFGDSESDIDCSDLSDGGCVPQGEHSKRNFDVFSQSEKKCAGYFHERADRYGCGGESSDAFRNYLYRRYHYGGFG